MYVYVCMYVCMYVCVYVYVCVCVREGCLVFVGLGVSQRVFMLPWGLFSYGLLQVKPRGSFLCSSLSP